MISALALIGAPVVDIHNTEVGKIVDLIVDVHTDCVTHAVLFLQYWPPGAGQRASIVIPWKAFVFDSIENTFTLDIDAELLAETGLFTYYTYPMGTPC